MPPCTAISATSTPACTPGSAPPWPTSPPPGGRWRRWAAPTWTASSPVSHASPPPTTAPYSPRPGPLGDRRSGPCWRGHPPAHGGGTPAGRRDRRLRQLFPRKYGRRRLPGGLQAPGRYYGARPHRAARLFPPIRERRPEIAWFGPPTGGPVGLALATSTFALQPTLNRWMGRILDVPRALEGRGYPDVSGEVVVELSDPLFPDNAGPWLVRGRWRAGHRHARARSVTVPGPSVADRPFLCSLYGFCHRRRPRPARRSRRDRPKAATFVRPFRRPHPLDARFLLTTSQVAGTRWLSGACSG